MVAPWLFTSSLLSDDHRIIKCHQQWSLLTATKRQKVADILWTVQVDLAAIELTQAQLNDCQIYLYIRNKRCIGALVAENISVAYRVMSSNSNVMIHDTAHLVKSDDNIQINKLEPIKVTCGVSRIWVHKHHRRQGVAGKLLEAMRSSFIYGIELKWSQIAFSQPTQMGLALAKHASSSSGVLVYEIQ